MADDKKEKAEEKAEVKKADKKEEKKPAAKTAAKKNAGRQEKPEVKVEKKPTRARKTEDNQEQPVKDLKDLGKAVADEGLASPAEPSEEEKATASQPEERVARIDEHGRSYATGRRKDAVARVWLKRGSGKVIVNGKDQSIYFGRQTHRLILNQPFLVVNSVGHYDVLCTVKGGGLSGQAGAVRHGISRALENFDPEMRPALKKAGMLTRDARIVERKKVGKHKARRTKQWAKR